MSLPIVRTSKAKADLKQIFIYLEERNSTAAARLMALIDERCQLLAKMPRMGRSREELGSGLRSLVVESYVLFYRVEEEQIEVIRVLHGARDIGRIFGEES